jgi:hypothetical protein
MRLLFLPNINSSHTCKKPATGEKTRSPEKVVEKSLAEKNISSTASRPGTEYPGWCWDED